MISYTHCRDEPCESTAVQLQRRLIAFCRSKLLLQSHAIQPLTRTSAPVDWAATWSTHNSGLWTIVFFSHALTRMIDSRHVVTCIEKMAVQYRPNPIDEHVRCVNHLTLRAERQSARMSKITNDGLTRSGTGCFIAVPVWQQ